MVPGITVSSGNSPWDDAARYEGYIAGGIVINLADQQGRPMPVGTVVYLKIVQVEGSWEHNNFYFVDDPRLSAEAAEDLREEERLQHFTLVTNTPGHLSLYPTPTTGYLRKGSNGEDEGVYLIVEAGGLRGSARLINDSTVGDDGDPGIKPRA